MQINQFLGQTLGQKISKYFWLCQKFMPAFMNFTIPASSKKGYLYSLKFFQQLDNIIVEYTNSYRKSLLIPYTNFYDLDMLISAFLVFLTSPPMSASVRTSDTEVIWASVGFKLTTFLIDNFSTFCFKSRKCTRMRFEFSTQTTQLINGNS